MKILVFDIESTGLLYYRHAIHQLAGMVVVDDVIVEKFNLSIRPHENALIDEAALKVAGVTKEQILAYPDRTVQFNAFKTILNKHIDIYDPSDKLFLLGFNNNFFDNQFLRSYFTLQADESWGAYLFQNSLDAMVLATHYLAPIRHRMPSFKLSRVAATLDIPVDTTKLHDALWDAEITWEIYKKVRGKTIDDW